MQAGSSAACLAARTRLGRLGTYFPGNLLCGTPAGTHVSASELTLIQSRAEIIVL